MSKQLFYILIAVLAIIVVIVGLWWFFGGEEEGDRGAFNPFEFFTFPESGDPDGELGTGGRNGAGAEGEGAEGETTLPALRQITDAPVAGFTSLVIEHGDLLGDAPAATSTVVRYVETETGHIKEVDVETMEKVRISNTTIPRVHEALWNSTGDRVMLRYVANDRQTIETFSAELPIKDATSTEITGSFLPQNIEELVVAADGDILYMRKVENQAQFVEATFAGTGRNIIFTFPFTEWLIQKTSGGDVFLTTKPSASAQGYLYELVSGSLDRVFGGVSGLTALMSPSGGKAFLSISTGNGIQGVLFDLREEAAEVAPVATLSEKCVWGEDGEALFCGAPKTLPPGEYPDMWYQGRVTFDDTLRQIDYTAGTLKTLADPLALVQQTMDIIKLTLGPNERYLFFVNKKDGTLWLLDLNPQPTTNN